MSFVASGVGLDFFLIKCDKSTQEAIHENDIK